MTGLASTLGRRRPGAFGTTRGCMNCHVDGGRGHLPEGADVDAVSLVMRIDIPPGRGPAAAAGRAPRQQCSDPTYGLQLQASRCPGTPPSPGLHGALQRSRCHWRTAVVLTCGSRRTVSMISAMGRCTCRPACRRRVWHHSHRPGPARGDRRKDIIAREDPDDSDGDGISGRANRVWSRAAGAVALGRFGHKAGLPSIDEQSQAAFSIDLGLSVPLYPDAAGDRTEHQADCRSAPNGNSVQFGGLEAHRQLTDLVSFYVSHLAVLARQRRSPRRPGG